MLDQPWVLDEFVDDVECLTAFHETSGFTTRRRVQDLYQR
jgi:hypothetical protein